MPGLLQEFGPRYRGREGFSIGPFVTRPKSRGSVTLNSANPLDAPLIDTNYFDHPEDIAAMIRGGGAYMGAAPPTSKFGPDSGVYVSTAPPMSEFGPGGGVYVSAESPTRALTLAVSSEAYAWPVTGSGEPLWPELQVAFTPFTLGSDFGILSPHILGIKKDLYQQYFHDLGGREGFSIGPFVTRPKSRGSVTLNSANPLDAPLIDTNYFDHPEDIAAMIRGLKFSLKLASMPALKEDFDAVFHDRVLPGCEHEVLYSDKYWECYSKVLVGTLYHPCGTCKMGPDSDTYSVLDEQLRVRHVAGLRVIDASIMPVVTTGNINAPTIMIAEKASDMIKLYWDAPITF
nr:choline oxidase-like [Cherax quadricarinatus]